MTSGHNAAQVEFWNAEPGRNWAEFQPDLDLLHGAATTLLLDRCAAAPGERVLDVGCGAGASTLALAEAVAPGGRVLGIDVSEPLLARARRRAEEREDLDVLFEAADAQERRFEPGSFDLVASRFGMMFFDDPPAAFANLANGLVAGGRIAFVAWAGPEKNPWFTLPERIATARLGAVAPSPPDAPGPMAFRDRDRVLGILRDAGFVDCAGDLVATHLHHPGGVPAVVRLAARVGPTARIMREKGGGPDDAEAIAAELAGSLAAYTAPDGLRIPAGLNVFVARRP